VFFAKLNDKYHTFNERKKPSNQDEEEEEEDDESFEPEPMLDIAIDEELAED
jgi:hypothetical protein